MPADGGAFGPTLPGQSAPKRVEPHSSIAKRGTFFGAICARCGKHGFGLTELNAQFYCPLCVPKQEATPVPVATASNGGGGGGGKGGRGAGRDGLRGARAAPYTIGGRGKNRYKAPPPTDKDPLDPMDPAAYSETPRGNWGRGLGDHKGIADVGAGGALWEQRSLPSPGSVVRAREAREAEAAKVALVAQNKADLEACGGDGGGDGC